MFDTLIIGGGVAGMQCALILGSAKCKPFAEKKEVGIILHQRTSHLQNAVFNNVLGLPIGKQGHEILPEGKAHLTKQYPHVKQIEKEKVLSVLDHENGYKVVTNKGEHHAKTVVLAMNFGTPFDVEGLNQYVEKHGKADSTKERIQLRNVDNVIKEGLYVCGTLAGCTSQYAIAAGSGASVGSDILRLWNGGTPVEIHDKIE